MSTETFATLGKIKAIEKLFDNSPYTPFSPLTFNVELGGKGVEVSKFLLEGIDFDLTYFPLKHLGHKAVTMATSELFAATAYPQTLSVNIGVSSKLDFKHIQLLFFGILSAAKEYNFSKVALDLNPSKNGLCISVSACGEIPSFFIDNKKDPVSKDLICISGNIGAAYFGMKLLDIEKQKFNTTGKDESANFLEKYKMMIGAYLMPELNPNLVPNLKTSGICPIKGYVVNRGLADTIKRLIKDTGLGAKIYANKIPFEGNSFDLGKKINIDPISAAMNGGEDYKILFLISMQDIEKFRHDFPTFDIIGHLAQRDVADVLVTPDGVELPITAQGW